MRRLDLNILDVYGPYTINITYPTDTTEVYVYLNKDGATLATLTVTYTDNTKVNISSVVKT